MHRMRRRQRWLPFLALVGFGCVAACSTTSTDTSPPAAPADAEDAATPVDPGNDDASPAGEDAGHDGASATATTTGTGTISGPIAGRTFVVADAYAELDSSASQPVVVKMRDYVGACAMAQVRASKAGSTEFKLEIHPTTSGAAFPGPGTYPVLVDKPDGGSPAFYVEAQAKVFDGACSSTTIARGSSGTVTLSSVTSTEVKGTFDVTFPSGRVTGTFDVGVCTIPSSTVTPTCKP